MKFLTVMAIAAGFLLTFAAAQAQSIPRGSYQRSCTGIAADWHKLAANCRTRTGSWNYSELEDYRQCNTDITNEDGRLRCADDDQGDDWQDGDWRHQDGEPRGSYQQTCRRIDIEGRSLTAECKDRGGRWRYSELDDFRRCRGDIANADGILQCRDENDDDDDHGGYGQLPGGSWRQSCRNHRVYGSVLYAECRTRYGRYNQTSIDVRKCRRDIRNVDGRLVCDWADGGVQGYARITIYKHSNFVGKSRSYSDDVSDLNNDGFGNIASSALVQGGVWQICDQPHYRGYCIVLDRSHSNFAIIGFNDRAESLRRIR